MYSSETERLEETNFRNRRDVTVDYVRRILPLNGQVLDVGCGAAPVISELRKHGIACVGLEYSEDMLAHARTRLRSMNLDDGGLLQGDCCDMPYEDSSFDAVVCLGVISYVENYDIVLQEIRRVLKPGGYALISFRNKFSPDFSDPVRLAKLVWKALFMRKQEDDYEIGRFMDHREFVEKMAEQGFEYRDFFGIGFGPFAIRRRKLFSEKTSIRISNAITALFKGIGLRAPFRWLADVSLWVYVAPCAFEENSDT